MNTLKRILTILRAFLSHTIFAINIGFIIWLLVCLYASSANPADIKYLGIISLSSVFPIIANCVFIIFWLFTRKKWRSIPSLLTLIISRSLVFAVLGINLFAKNDLTPKLNGLKIMTWNVHGLGLFDKPLKKNKPQEIFELIDRQEPDVVCLIEFYTNVDGSNKEAAAYFKKAGYKEYRFMYDNDYGSKIYLGNAVFSKYPLSNFEEVTIDEYIKMMRCDVQLPEDKKVRLFTVHLQSFLIGDEEKAIIEEVKSNTKKLEKQKAKSLGFLEKLHRAYEKRAPQAILARAEIDKSPHPTILCADLNDVPGSYTYFTIKGGMSDVFTDKGIGLGRTYNFIAPNLRIDYIFYDPKGLNLLGYHTLKTPSLSDHNPVIANFLVK